MDVGWAKVLEAEYTLSGGGIVRWIWNSEGASQSAGVL